MSVSYLAILSASVAVFIIGALWYSPVLFGNLWMRLSNISQKEIAKTKQKGGMGGLMLISFIGTIVMAWVLEYLFSVFGITDVYNGMIIGLLIWFGFIATTALNGLLWENKPFGVYVINIAHQLVSLIVMSAILSVW